MVFASQMYVDELSAQGPTECGPGREGLLLNGRRRIPLLASPQGGVAERTRKCREASFESEDGVVFRARRAENHPGCVGFGGFALILDDAATPPCGDARRGLRLCQLSNNPSRRGLHSRRAVL